MRKIILIATVLLTAGAYADVTYAPFGVNFRNAAGELIVDGTYALIGDLDNDGWGLPPLSYDAQSPGEPFGPQDNSSDWLWDSDDWLMDLGQIVNGVATPLVPVATDDLPAGYTPGVDEYHFLWFDLPYGQTSPGYRTWYGAELLGTLGNDPGDYSPDVTGGNTTLTTVIPEPTTALLAILGGTALLGRRRRKE
jgi:hypothetical protein